MFPHVYTTRILFALAALTTCLPFAAAQSMDGLVAELSVARSLFHQNEPVRLRLTLFNAGDAPIEIPVQVPEGDEEGAVGLPPSLVFGSREVPHLFLGFDAERLSPVRFDEAVSGRKTTIRLAPQTSLGTEIDLRAVDRRMRYSGGFFIEWRPFDDLVPAATVRFRVEARKHAILVTDYGKITFELAYDQAPNHVENFLDLARDRFYEGTTFHRIIPGALIQGGSPDGTSSGVRPDGRLLEAEFHATPIQPGTLVMSRRQDDDNSASCQFFIALGRLPELDGKYTVFGQATGPESMRTLDRLAELPTDQNGTPRRAPVIRSVTLLDAEPEGRTSKLGG